MLTGLAMLLAAAPVMAQQMMEGGQQQVQVRQISALLWNNAHFTEYCSTLWALFSQFSATIEYIDQWQFSTSTVFSCNIFELIKFHSNWYTFCNRKAYP